VSTVHILAVCLMLALRQFFFFRVIGMLIIEDNDKVWFPTEDLHMELFPSR